MTEHPGLIEEPQREFEHTRPAGTPWSAWDRDTLALAYAAAESLDDIGARLGRSRSAVAGEAYRLGLEHPRRVEGRCRQRAEDDDDPFSNPRLRDPEPGECRYIHGDVRERWRYCGAPVEDHAVEDDRSSYCPQHWKLCHMPRPKPKLERRGAIWGWWDERS